MRENLKAGGLLLLALMLPACKSAPKEMDTKPDMDAAAESMDKAMDKVSYMTSVRAAMDTSVNPCDDFYQYACGGWMASTEIPSDKSSWGRSFDEIWDRNRATLRVLIEKDAKEGAATDAGLKQISDYYESCSDTDAVNSLGLKPLEPYLAQIDAIDSRESLMTTVADLHMIDVDAFFGIYVTPDYKNPDVYTFAISQAGLGLPDRDYYLIDEARMASTREAYLAHVTKAMMVMGIDEAEANARATAVIAFETLLAERSVPRTELRDAQKRYNPMPLSDVVKSMGDSGFSSYLKAINADGVETVVVATPSFFEGYGEVLAGADMKVLKDYLRFQLLKATGSLLTEEIEMMGFDFYGKTLRGQQEQQPRWKRCVTRTGFDLQDTVGKYFVEQEFAGDSKDTALTMIHSIEEAFAAGLPELTWMDEATQARAIEKAQSVTNKIGYPDTWRDLSGIAIEEGNFFGNVLAVRAHESERWLKRIDQPVDKTEWYMPTFMVNAYYNPSANEMVFPAGILQPPFFDADFPMSMNLGAIGMVMGHELTHGFDDQGRKFDGTGRLVEWWEPEVSARFEEAAQCVVDRYNGFEVREGLNVNGQLTLGENIADLGGLKQSFRAHQAWVEAKGMPEGLGDMTADQLFFTAFAQSWCSMARPEYEEILVRTDSHSPARFRVLGSLSNFPEFGEAFQCEVGSPMRPETTCQVW